MNSMATVQTKVLVVAGEGGSGRRTSSPHWSRSGTNSFDEISMLNVPSASQLL